MQPSVPNEHLDYLAPRTTQKRFFANTIPLLGVCLAAAILLGYLLLFWIPHREDVFRVFRTSLPAVTAFVLDISRIARTSVVATILAAIAATTPFLLGGLLTLIEDETRQRNIRRNVTWGLVVLTVITAGFIYVAISEPIWSLLESVGGT